MIRLLLSMSACIALVACGDGRGSPYSSQRAAPPAPTYIPVTPGATPILTSPIAVTPGAVPVTQATSTSAAAPVITQASVSLPRSPAAPEPVTRFATGPIYSACQSSGRRAATRERCGCVQWVANQELSPADQRRGAGYFDNQHGLQEVRQSSERISSNGAFWEAWKSYGESATRQCQGT